MSLIKCPAWLVLIFCWLSLPADASDFENGVRAAKSKNWQEAEKFFKISVAENTLSANAYYNLGTSLAAQDKGPEAIWALEKSLKLNPKLKGARNNIQYCYTKLGIADSWEPALPYFQDKAYQLGIDRWTYISIALGLISAGLIFVFIVAAKSAMRKISLIFAVFTVLGLIFTLKSALNSYDFKYSITHAVLMQDENSVFHDAAGNMRFNLYLKSGTRYAIEGISSDRIGLVMKNDMVVWIAMEDVMLF